MGAADHTSLELGGLLPVGFLGFEKMSVLLDRVQGPRQAGMIRPNLAGVNDWGSQSRSHGRGH